MIELRTDVGHQENLYSMSQIQVGCPEGHTV